jgi:hypothetical protein
MSELTTEKELVNEIKSGLSGSVSSSIGASFYTQWQEVRAMPSVVVLSEGGSEKDHSTGIFIYSIVVAVLSEPITGSNPEADHYTLADGVLEYCYASTRVSSWNAASNEAVLGDWVVKGVKSSVDKGRIFRTEIDLEIIAKPENF